MKWMSTGGRLAGRFRGRRPWLGPAAWACAALVLAGSNDGAFAIDFGPAAAEGRDAEVAAALHMKHAFMLHDTGEGGRSLNQPAGVAVGAEGKIYVLDTLNSRVVVYDRDGAFLSEFGSFGAEPGQFALPMAIATDAAGSIYVADSRNARIQKLDSQGNSLLVVDLTAGTDDEKRPRPIGVAVDPRGRIFAADAQHHCVRVFDKDGKPLFTFGEVGKGEGQFAFPHSIAIRAEPAEHSEGDAQTTGPVTIYVVDIMNSRVQVFDDNGKFLWSLGQQGDRAGAFSRPKGLAVDREGRIYVSDSLQLLVQVFDAEGKFLHVVGRFEDDDLQFSSPAGLWVDDDGRLYVADRLRSRVHVLVPPVPSGTEPQAAQ